MASRVFQGAPDGTQGVLVVLGLGDVYGALYKIPQKKLTDSFKKLSSCETTEFPHRRLRSKSFRDFVGLFAVIEESKMSGTESCVSALACPSATSQPSARARASSARLAYAILGKTFICATSGGSSKPSTSAWPWWNVLPIRGSLQKRAPLRD